MDSSLLPKRVSAQVGMTAILDPIIGPGALLSRYSIDWKQINGSNSVTVARIAGPRSINPVNDPDMKYSVHPSSFALMINSVSYADRGSYRGVLYVTDPEGEQYVYDQDLIPTTTLDVYGECCSIAGNFLAGGGYIFVFLVNLWLNFRNIHGLIDGHGIMHILFCR